MSRHSGDVWQLTKNSLNNWLMFLPCEGCKKPFKEGDWVVQATTRPARVYGHQSYARIRHIACYTDAHGEPLVEIC